MTLSFQFFNEYKQKLIDSGIDLGKKVNHITQPKVFPNLDHYNQVSAVFSSRIEGNSLDLNSFLNSSASSKTKEVTEIEDLLLAYRFAEKSEFNEANFCKNHAILSKNFLIKDKQGVYRDEPIGVFSSQGLVYMAIESDKLKSEMTSLFAEINELLSKKLDLAEAFYYASLLHLRIAHLHPFADGNGRVARLSEKWFLSQFLGKKTWWIKSEEYYWKNLEQYYANLNLGVDYYHLDYNKSLPFLTMLTNSL